MSITDLADACEVGDTSVYRFCRTMKLQGYQEFKMKLSLSMSEKEEAKVCWEKLKMMILWHASDGSEHECMRESYMLLDHHNLLKIVRMIEEARRVFFFGIGDSLLAAEEARNKFLRITGKVSCITDPHIQAMAASTTSGRI